MRGLASARGRCGPKEAPTRPASAKLQVRAASQPSWSGGRPGQERDQLSGGPGHGEVSGATVSELLPRDLEQRGPGAARNLARAIARA